MIKHAPGPWFAEAVDCRWRVWDDAGIACICDVHAGVEPDPSGATHARLIAAAPDLLAACEHVRDTIREFLPTVMSEDLTAIEAAIAKARGES